VPSYAEKESDSPPDFQYDIYTVNVHHLMKPNTPSIQITNLMRLSNYPLVNLQKFQVILIVMIIFQFGLNKYRGKPILQNLYFINKILEGSFSIFFFSIFLCFLSPPFKELNILAAFSFFYAILLLGLYLAFVGY
jgi:hypothetical protein